MTDYEAMYLTLFSASTKAINLLTEAQKEAEEIYINSGNPEFRVLPPKKDDE